MESDQIRSPQWTLSNWFPKADESNESRQILEMIEDFCLVYGSNGVL
jgi:hypothetical protein